MAPFQHSLATVIDALAKGATSCEWTTSAICENWQIQVGRKQKWMESLANGLTERFSTRPSKVDVATQLAETEQLTKAYNRSKLLRRIAWYAGEAKFVPASDKIEWILPPLVQPADLAELLDAPEMLLWQLADPQRLFKLARCNYRFRWSKKRTGGVRIIEAPKSKLKTVQRRMLDKLISCIPPHVAAHGFRSNRNIRTTVEPHVGKKVVIRIDLRDFFASITGSHVAAIFRTAGYPENVTQLMTQLCTSRVPRQVWQIIPNEFAAICERETRDRLDRSHLPQGAPSSPALANVAAFRLDKRLHGLARSMLASYTRYADDLVFSGDERLANNARRVVSYVSKIAAAEGFEVNPRKTRVMRQSVRQSACGLTVNQTVNTSRKDYKLLEAILHNCVVHGPHTQNRHDLDNFQQHLVGRIVFHESINARRGQKLRKLFSKICW